MRRMIVLGLLLALVLCGPQTALAQASPDDPAPTGQVAPTSGDASPTAPGAPGDSERQPLTQLIAQGGWVMYVLVFLSALGMFMTVWFLLGIRTSAMLPEGFRTEAEQAAEQGDVRGLDEICQNHDSAAADIVGAACATLRENPIAEYQVITEVVAAEGGRQASVLWRRIEYLRDIAVVAPMVGLLGTVLGMIDAFVGLKDSFATVRPMELSAGVSKALVTTAGGLIVGIAAMLLFSYFRGRVSQVLSDLEEGTMGIVQRVLFRSRSHS